MAVLSMKALLETGVHFGHRTRKWNPRMKPYIFTERNGIHIIDLQQTLESLEKAYDLIRDTIAAGSKILFVGTKRQGQETIEVEATRCGMPYVNARWLGGTLTNWRTIRSRIDELEELERRRDSGEFDLLTKREALSMTRRIDKLEERLGGIREMRSLPDLLFVVDVRKEDTAIHEANLLNIPVIALVDTNCDPFVVDYVIPSNDDAIRAIKLLTSTIADAVLEGMGLRKEEEEETGVAADPASMEAMTGAEMSDEELLGEATLAKLQTGEFGAKDLQKEDSKEIATEAEEEEKVEGVEAEADEDEKIEDVEPEAEEEEKVEGVEPEAEEDEKIEDVEAEEEEKVEDVEPEAEEDEKVEGVEPEAEEDEKIEDVEAEEGGDEASEDEEEELKSEEEAEPTQLEEGEAK